MRIGLSGLPLIKHYELGECIKEAADRLGRKTVVIASGDLSHKCSAASLYALIVLTIFFSSPLPISGMISGGGGTINAAAIPMYLSSSLWRKKNGRPVPHELDVPPELDIE